MKLTILAIFMGFLTLCVYGHTIDENGNCIADCHPPPLPPTPAPAAPVFDINHAVVDLEVQEEYSCGTLNSTYANSDRVVLCLFFDQMTPPQKVVFSPRVDSFEVLQIKGLYEKFRVFNEATGVRSSFTAMASGVKSAPTVFKQNNAVAGVVELQITMNEGNITRVDWLHGCGLGCNPFSACADAYVVDQNGYGLVAEQNCFEIECELATPARSTCDTQVFVTWTGTDKNGEYCESVNYSIHGFGRYGSGGYMASARGIAEQTYAQVEPIPTETV